MLVEVLLIEDNEGDWRLIQQITSRSTVPVRTTVVPTCASALAILADGRFLPNLIISDMSIPGAAAPELLKRCNAMDIPVVVFSGSVSLALDAIIEGLHRGKYRTRKRRVVDIRENAVCSFTHGHLARERNRARPIRVCPDRNLSIGERQDTQESNRQPEQNPSKSRRRGSKQCCTFLASTQECASQAHKASPRQTSSGGCGSCDHKAFGWRDQ